MAHETVNERELAQIRMEAKKRAREAWESYRDESLKQQIDSLTDEQRTAIDLVVEDFIYHDMVKFRTKDYTERNDFAFLRTKPVGGYMRDGEFSGIEHCQYRPIHQRWGQEEIKQRDINFIEGLTPEIYPVLGIPFEEFSYSSFVQIIPASEDGEDVIIRYRGKVTSSNLDNRITGWGFNMLSHRGKHSVQEFLRSNKDGKLLVFIARNIVTAANPEAAIFCDAGAEINGRMDVVDFTTFSHTYYPPSDKLSGGQGQTKFYDVDNIPSWINALQKSSPPLGIPLQQDSDYVPVDYEHPKKGKHLWLFNGSPINARERWPKLVNNYPPKDGLAFE